MLKKKKKSQGWNKEWNFIRKADTQNFVPSVGFCSVCSL